jgi:hypothetical protein
LAAKRVEVTVTPVAVVLFWQYAVAGPKLEQRAKSLSVLADNTCFAGVEVTAVLVYAEPEV